MIRRCDGTDPNLTRPIRDGEQQSGPWPGSVPCDCGLTFDDVGRLTTWPHHSTGGGRIAGLPPRIPRPVPRRLTVADVPPLPPPTPSSLTDAQANRLVAALFRLPAPPRSLLARRWCWLRTRHHQPSGGLCRCRCVFTYRPGGVVRP